MPRQLDPDVEERILNAAQKLWKKGGEKGLTVRTVARVAGTNTPAIYRRFRNRQDIVLALAQRVQQELVKALQSSRSPQEACALYLEFSSAHPCEYELLSSCASRIAHSAQARRLSAHWASTLLLELIRRKTAERPGESAVEHTRVSLALWALTHGTTMLLISKAVPAQDARELRAGFAAALEILGSRLR